MLDIQINQRFDGYTLIIPSVSVGNVGQLTVDLLISSLDMKNRTSIWHSSIIPAVGANPFVHDSDEIHTACELFWHEKTKIAAIQLRSNIDRRKSDDFFSKLASFIKDQNFKNIILLTSSFAHEKRNVNSSSYRYIKSNTCTLELKDQLVEPLERTPFGKTVIHGSGFIQKLYEKIQQDTPVLLLVKYCSEGDNRPDAIATLQLLIDILNIGDSISLMKCPMSWHFVFGNPPPVEMF